MSEASLQGRVAIVTGASSGIGAATARALDREGALVALAARRKEELLEVRSGFTGESKSLAVPTDVTDRHQAEDLVRRVEEELGPPDILVNCAGVMYYTLMKNLHWEEWAQTVDVICMGTMHCIGTALPGMLERGRGHIVTISSDAGRKVFPGLSVYSAAKFFLEALSQGLRLETAGTGIKVTTVQPGNVDTDLLTMSTDREAEKHYAEPTGARLLEPEDISSSILHALEQPDHVAVNEILVQPRDEPV